MTILNKKQLKFVSEYCVDQNATQAAIRAGYSKKTAYAIGAANLKKVEIQKAIEGQLADNAKRNEVTIDGLTQQLDAAIALGMETGKLSAVVAAINTKAKFHGLDKPKEKDKREDTEPSKVEIRFIGCGPDYDPFNS